MIQRSGMRTSRLDNDPTTCMGPQKARRQFPHWHGFTRRLVKLVCGAVIPVWVQAAPPVAWHSIAVGADVQLQTIEPGAVSSTPPPLIIYLENLPSARVGTEPDSAILEDFRRQGYEVAVLDYHHAAAARWPHLNRDIVALREGILRENSFAGHPVDLGHVFVVPAGDRLKRDVIFYRGRQRTLGMDIVYPSRPKKPVGALIEFSCDNQNRMGDYSLAVCSDTILEAAATEGFAVAMADHPVPAPYKGLDPMPDCAWKTKAAVRTLRAESEPLGLSGRIVPVGFSRGSGMALMLVTTMHQSEFEGHGEHPDVDSSVQGAVVLSGRFTYLDLLPNDHMISRYDAAWGPRATHPDLWRKEGALDYLAHATLPMFLSINCSEGKDARHQMDVLRHRLDALRSPYEFHAENTPRGHKVPLDADVLEPLLTYLEQRLRGMAPRQPDTTS